MIFLGNIPPRDYAAQDFRGIEELLESPGWELLAEESGRGVNADVEAILTLLSQGKYALATFLAGKVSANCELFTTFPLEILDKRKKEMEE